MTRSIRVGLLTAVVAALVGCGPASRPERSGQELETVRSQKAVEALGTVLTGAAQAPGLTTENLLQMFPVANLRDLLGQDANTYRRFGVVGAVSQDYVVDGNPVTAQMFELGDSTHAQALFLWLKQPGGQEVALGQQANFAEGKLETWKDSKLLVLKGGAGANVLDSEKKLAQSILDRVPQTGPLLDLVAAMEKVLTDPEPTAIKVVFSQLELLRAGPAVVVPYYEAKDLMSLEQYGEEHPVVVALASVRLSESTGSASIFFLARYPRADRAVQALREYGEQADKDRNPEIRNALVKREGDVVGGVWRPTGDAEKLLDELLTQVKARS